MQQQDWASRWSEGRIGFHQSEVTDFLTEYADVAWGSEPIGRVYVPLCGKTLDMAFLAERAVEVVGVEYVEQAVAEFFDERGLTPEVRREPLVRYRAGRYSLYSADFFDLTVAEIGQVDAVFDRAALVAIPPATRQRYADRIHSLLRPGGRYLLVTFDYDQTKMGGPPFSVSFDDVTTLFGENFDIEQLATRDVMDDRFRNEGLSRMDESAVVLTRR